MCNDIETQMEDAIAREDEELAFFNRMVDVVVKATGEFPADIDPEAFRGEVVRRFATTEPIPAFVDGLVATFPGLERSRLVILDRLSTVVADILQEAQPRIAIMRGLEISLAIDTAAMRELEGSRG